MADSIPTPAPTEPDDDMDMAIIWIPIATASTDRSSVAAFARSATCFRVEAKHQAEDEGDQSEQRAQHDDCAHF